MHLLQSLLKKLFLPTIFLLTHTFAYATLEVSPSQIEFGTFVKVTAPIVKTFTVTNTEDDPVTLTEDDFNWSSSHFTIPSVSGKTSILPLILFPGASQSFDVVFDPGTDTTDFWTSIHISKDGLPFPWNTSYVYLHASVGPPVLSLSDTLLDFGDCTTAASCGTYTISATNTGFSNLTLTDIVGTSAEFMVKNPPTLANPIVLPPGKSFYFDITLTPSADGPTSGILTFKSHGDGVSVLDVPLSIQGIGNPLKIKFSQTGLDFGSVDSAFPKTMIVTVENLGKGTVEVSNLAIVPAVGTNPASFKASYVPDRWHPTDKLPFIIYPGTPVQLNVTAIPKNAGDVQATLQLVTTKAGSGGVIELPLKAVGQIPQVSIDPIHVSFGDVAVSTSTQDSIITITNNGSGALRVNKMIWDHSQDPQAMIRIGGYSADGFVLRAGQTKTLSTWFQPTQVGFFNVKLVLQTNAGNDILISIDGNAVSPQASIDKNQLRFTPITIGQKSTTLTTQLKNTGTIPLTNLSVRLEGVDAKAFHFVAPTNLSQPLLPGATLDLSFYFSPGSVIKDPQIATATISADSLSAPIVVQLSGGSLGNAFQVNPTALDFGTVMQGQAVTGSFEVKNTSAHPEDLSLSIDPTKDIWISFYFNDSYMPQGFNIHLEPGQTMKFDLASIQPPPVGTYTQDVVVASASDHTVILGTIPIKASVVAKSDQVTVTPQSTNSGCSVTVSSSASSGIVLWAFITLSLLSVSIRRKTLLRSKR